MRDMTLALSTRTVTTALCLAAFVGLAATPAPALDCTQIDIPGARSTTAFGINSLGDIVGQFADAKNVSHGFLIDHRSGQITAIDVPGSTLTQANGSIRGATWSADTTTPPERTAGSGATDNSARFNSLAPPSP